MPVSTRRSARSTPSTAPMASNTASPSPSWPWLRLCEINTYKVTTPLLVFFATTHTIAGLLLPSDFGAEGNAVFSAMQTVRFSFMGSRRTLHDFYMGFGLGMTVLLFMSVAVSWVLSVASSTAASDTRSNESATKGGLKKVDDGNGDGEVRSNGELRPRELLSTLKWILFVSNFANMLLCYVYFFVPPMVVSTVIAVLLGWECFKDWTS